MRLVYRLTLLLLLAACLVLTIYGVLTVRREAHMFETSMIEDARLNGQTLRSALEELALSGGAEAVARLVAEAGGGKLEFRCVQEGPEGFPGVALSESERTRLGAGEEVVQIHRARPGQLRLYLPLRLKGDARALLEVRESLQREEDYLAQSLRRIAVASVLLVILSGGLAFLIGFRVVGRPMERLTEKARRVGRGDLSGPVHVTQRDEIGQLARAMNEMCTQLALEMEQRRQAEGQLRHAERLATVGKLASGLAHELGTPLNVILGRALQVVEDPGAGAESIEAAQIVVAQAERMSATIRQLLDFARRDRRREVRVDLRALLEEVANLLGTIARGGGVKIEVSAPEHAPAAKGDPDQLRQALTNLALNGIHSMRRGGTLELALLREFTARPGQTEPLSAAVIAVRDQGEGIPTELREKVFEPFFTTKETGEGTGLGLAITQGIVADHGGWITVESEVERGSEFKIHLPEEKQP